MGYFRELPNMRYPSFLPDKNSSLEFVETKNLFRRIKLRDDFKNMHNYANENINSENIAISNEGIKVKSAKEIIYFLLATEPLTLMLFLIEFLMSININTKNINTKIMLEIIRISRLSSFSLIKLLSIKVKNVIKAKEIVSIKITMINKFLFNKGNII